MNVYLVHVQRVKSGQMTENEARLIQAGRARVAVNTMLSFMPDLRNGETLKISVQLKARNMKVSEYQKQQAAEAAQN